MYTECINNINIHLLHLLFAFLIEDQVFSKMCTVLLVHFKVKFFISVFVSVFGFH